MIKPEIRTVIGDIPILCIYNKLQSVALAFFTCCK